MPMNTVFLSYALTVQWIIDGPVRMNYARLLPHLEYFASTLGKLLSETYTEQ